MKEPWFRNKEEIWILINANSEKVMGDSFETFTFHVKNVNLLEDCAVLVEEEVEIIIDATEEVSVLSNNKTK